MRSKNNRTPKNSTNALLAGSNNTLSANANEFIILGDSNIVGEGKNIALIGSSGCIIGEDCSNVTLINSSGCIVTTGLKNISLINTFDQTIEESNTYYLNNAQQMPTAPTHILANVYSKKVTVPSADVLNMYSVPYELIPAPPNGYFINVLNAVCYNDFNTTPYSTELDVMIVNDTGAYLLYSFVGILSAIQKVYVYGLQQTGSIGLQIAPNTAVHAIAANNNPTLGDGDLTFYLTYTIQEL